MVGNVIKTKNARGILLVSQFVELKNKNENKS